MTFDELCQDTYRRLNKNTSSPDTATATRIKAFLNQRHRELLAQPDCQQLRDEVLTLTTVTGTARYALPQAVARLNRMWDTTNQRVLTEQSLAWYRDVATDPSTQSGNPEAFVFLGQTRVAQQPADASQLWVKSTSASDTQTIYIEGTITGGYRQTVNTTLTGTTAKQIGSLATWVTVDNVYLSTAAVGTVTLMEDSGTGTELARIALGATMPRYWTVYLWPTPSSALTLTMDITREVSDMAQATDEPILPPDFHRLLVYGACADECLKLDDPRYGTFKSEWAQGLADLKYWLHARPSYQPGSERSLRGNNLGAWFPAGRW